MKFLVVNDDDLVHIEVCVAAASTSGANIELKTETKAYLGAVAECQLVVNERLHSLVLAAAAGVPLVALEYQPKGLDSKQSTDRGDMVVRTDAVTAGSVLELVRHVMNDWDGEGIAQFRSVVTLRGVLVQELDRMMSDA